MNLEKLRSDRYLIPIAYFCIYFIWGSTYLATDWAFQSFPPFFMTAIRFITAGLILLSISYQGVKTATVKQLKNAAFFGILILGIGSGGTMWSVLYLDTGMASLIVGCEPLLLVLLSWLLVGQRASFQKLLGVGLGMIGMYILVSQETITTNPDAYKGIIAISIAIVSWTIGSIYIKQMDMPESKVANTAIQMLAAGFVLFMVSTVLQEDLTTIPARFTWKSFFSLLYLLFFGSIIAYSAFNYLLLKDDPRKVATVTYINPIIALALGAYLNDEVITTQSAWAATILILGVVFIIREDKVVTAARQVEVLDSDISDLKS
ncbi:MULTISPECIES: EamA family transporter [unclassified Aureispira]|uniref:EamA family transporter n=1 Tax=unclassified Aureispira TaxID=2649989 RepID=UPI00069923EC|nr:MULTISPECIES: EamA family transporter [unclassified Aureispira]WMX17346.1 EamA family transporter [Aureispira sp. CCB-E]